MSNDLLRNARKLHLYLGVFTTPALLFFALTGALQTAGLHEPQPGSTYQPPHWIATLAQLHKHQTLEVRQRPAGGRNAAARAHDDDDAVPAKTQDEDAAPSAASAATTSTPAASATTPNATAPARPAAPAHRSAVPMKAFFLVVCLSLFLSTLTGIYMAYRYARKNWVITAWLAAGIIIPLILLKL